MDVEQYKYKIDLNADIGEGIGNEKLLLPFVSSCNIACGAHAGNETIIAHVMTLAKDAHVKIGAHPGYPDKDNFGRKSMLMSEKTFKKSMQDQLDLFTSTAKQENVMWHHIKPHGALYNDLATDEKLAVRFIEVIKKYRKKLVIPYGSIMSPILLSYKVPFVVEGFADRAYTNQLQLVPRKQKGAVLHCAEHVAEQVLAMVLQEKVKTISQKIKSIKVQTICVHGDNQNAINILKYLHEQLNKNQIQVMA